MRAKLILCAVLALLVAGGATATAAPEARYVGYGGPVASLGCTGMTIGGAANTGLLGDIDTAAYRGCSLFGSTMAVTPRLPWTLSASTPTTYQINDIEVDISGSFCAGTVAGSAAGTYDSGTGVLTVNIQTTTVTYLDPGRDCLGLIAVGQRLPVLSGSYDVVVAG